MFKKNKEQKDNPAQGDRPSLSDKAAGKIAGLMISIQTKFAYLMNKTISGLSIKRIKIFLILFCFLWGGLSVYFIIHAVFGSKQALIKVDKVSRPQHIDRAGDEEMENKIDIETYQQIQAYRSYMNSTHQTIRPGLLDSMTVLEQLYLSQQKNEANEK